MNEGLALIGKYLPLLIPIILLQLGLMVFALYDLIKRPFTRGPKWVWVLVIVMVNLFGPIIYLVFGRKED
ncbi:MAG: PLDc_N domain-containing protein [Anaerolineae bacterium]|nr:PLDc_N domain-containing protein [Anaerolineae bacterium]